MTPESLLRRDGAWSDVEGVRGFLGGAEVCGSGASGRASAAPVCIEAPFAPAIFFAAEISLSCPWSGIEFRSTYCATVGFEQISKSAAANTLRPVFPAPRDSPSGCIFSLSLRKSRRSKSIALGQPQPVYRGILPQFLMGHDAAWGRPVAVRESSVSMSAIDLVPSGGGDCGPDPGAAGHKHQPDPRSGAPPMVVGVASD